VRNLIQTDVAVPAPQLSMHGAGEQLVGDVKDPFTAGFVETSHGGITVAQQAILRIGHDFVPSIGGGQARLEKQHHAGRYQNQCPVSPDEKHAGFSS